MHTVKFVNIIRTTLRFFENVSYHVQVSFLEALGKAMESQLGKTAAKPVTTLWDIRSYETSGYF